MVRSVAERRLVACYGGTFDPVHRGHLGAALDLLERGCDEVRLLPCHVPPHRGTPSASPAHRLAMLRLAVGDRRGLIVDPRELDRSGPSYSVDTLASLTEELGPGVALGWVLGTDALAGLPSWHRWERLLELAHLLVLDRPGHPPPAEGPVAALLRERRVESVEALRERRAGAIWRVGQEPVPVSATAVRRRLETNLDAAGLLPREVWEYIRHMGLYGWAPSVRGSHGGEAGPGPDDPPEPPENE